MSASPFEPVKLVHGRSGHTVATVSAGELRRMARSIMAHEHILGIGLESRIGSHGPQIVASKVEGRWGKISSGSNPYAWQEVYDNGDGTFTDWTDGYSGTVSLSQAYEANGLTTVPANAIVRMYQAIGESAWLFTCPPVSGGTGTPGNPDTSVQFNDGGTFGGDSGFLWNKTNNTATITAASASTTNLISKAFSSAQTGPLVNVQNSAGTNRVRLFSDDLPGGALSGLYKGSLVLGSAVPTVISNVLDDILVFGINHANIGTRNTAKTGILGNYDIRGTGIPLFYLARNAIGGSTDFYDFAFQTTGKVVIGINVAGTDEIAWPALGQLEVLVADTGTTNVPDVLALTHFNPAGAGAGSGYGGNVALTLDSSTTARQNAGFIQWLWPDSAAATHATRAGQIIVGCYYTSTARNGLRLTADSGGIELAALERFALPGDITPTSLSGNQNDYGPANLANITVIRQASSVNVDVTGLQGGADGRIIIWINVSPTAVEQTMKNESALSAAANRLALNADVMVKQHQAYAFVYDATGIGGGTGRWRLLGMGSTTGSGITTLNTLTGAVQTFAKVDDTNVTLAISSSGSTHTFTMGWTGTLATARIANDAVTYAKMQNISAASKLLGRGSAGGSGDPEEITIGTGLSMSGTTLSAMGEEMVLANQVFGKRHHPVHLAFDSHVTGILPLRHGGTGSELSDPGADDRILFWDDSASTVTWLGVGTGLSISGTTLSTTGASGSSLLNAESGSSVGSTSTETDLSDSYTVAASTLAAGNVLRVTFRGWLMNQATGGSTLRLRLKIGGTTVLDSFVITNISEVEDAGGNGLRRTWYAQADLVVINASTSTEAQGIICWDDATSASNTWAPVMCSWGEEDPFTAGRAQPLDNTVSIDWTASKTVVLTAQWGDSGTHTIECRVQMIEKLA